MRHFLQSKKSYGNLVKLLADWRWPQWKNSTCKPSIQMSSKIHFWYIMHQSHDYLWIQYMRLKHDIPKMDFWWHLYGRFTSRILPLWGSPLTDSHQMLSFKSCFSRLHFVVYYIRFLFTSLTLKQCIVWAWLPA